MKFKFIINLLLLIILLLLPDKIFAAYLYFEPTSSKIGVGQEIEIKIKINAEDDTPMTADAVILFDSNSMTLVSVNPPSGEEKFFPRIVQKLSANKAMIGGSIEGSGTLKSGQGTIAILKFKSNLTGDNLINLSCSNGKKNDSNISLKKNGPVIDIIDCNKINQSRIAVVAQVQTTPSYPGGPTPISTPTGAATTGGPTLIPTTTPVITLTPSPIPTNTIAPTLTVAPTANITQSPLSPTATASSTMTTAPPTITIVIISPTVTILPTSGIVEATNMAVIAGAVFIGISLLIHLMIKI